jgi:hypothetical protein
LSQVDTAAWRRSYGRLMSGPPALPGEELPYSHVHLHGGLALRRFLPQLIDLI